MKKKPSFYISLIFSFLTLSLSVVYVIHCKVKGHYLGSGDLLIDIPIVAFAVSMLFVLIKKIPGAVKTVFTTLILVSTTILCTWLHGVGGYVEFDACNGVEEIALYNESLQDDAHPYLEPFVETEEYGTFEDISYYRYLATGIFQEFSTTFIVEYNDENFENEVVKINRKKDFYEKPVKSDDPVPVFTFEGFDFRLEKPDDDEDFFVYPKYMDLIGINDDTNEIAYVHFEDWDLDGVGQFEDIVNSYCGWGLILKDREENGK